MAEKDYTNNLPTSSSGNSKLVDLNGLAFYDQKIKAYIAEHGSGSGSISTFINNIRTYFITDPLDEGIKANIGDLLLYCKAGEIRNTDEVRFWRNVNNRMKDSRNNYTTTARYHGWVQPKIPFPVSLRYVGRKGDYDLWAVNTNAKGASSFTDYERMREEGELDKMKHLSLSKKCGVAIYRNGERISDFLKFRVVYDNEHSKYTLARW